MADEIVENPNESGGQRTRCTIFEGRYADMGAHAAYGSARRACARIERAVNLRCVEATRDHTVNGRSCRRQLHDRHASTRFSGRSEPPLFRGIRWSRCSGLPLLSAVAPQYTHACPSRALICAATRPRRLERLSRLGRAAYSILLAMGPCIALVMPTMTEQTLGAAAREARRAAIIEALRRTAGNRTEAAELLGINARSLFRILASDMVLEGLVPAGKSGRRRNA
jgi:transcriptional regulator with GAF, ATPase, and Fis domain